MKHVIDIQEYRGNRVARLLPAFRAHFDENHLHVNNFISITFPLIIVYSSRLNWNNLIV